MKKLLKVQQSIGQLSKNSENPFFKSQYLDLNDLLTHVQPLLNAEGLLLLQPIKDGKVMSEIWDTSDTSLVASSEIALPEIVDPQKLGSGITYYRRYTLKSLLAIAEKDDDGNSASLKKDEVVKLIANAKNSHDLTVIKEWIKYYGLTVEATKKSETFAK